MIMAVKHKILLVEDTESILKLTKFRLETMGFDVFTALDGASAVEAVRSDRPDLILLDHGLPDMDGFEVARTIKADNELKPIPIIMFTASQENLKNIESAGIQAGLLKPYEPEELLSKIRECLG